MSVFLDPASNLHPYKCSGPGKCAHCDRRILIYTTDEGTSHYQHDPATCVLCDPAYDLMPNPHWKGSTE